MTGSNARAGPNSKHATPTAGAGAPPGYAPDEAGVEPGEATPPPAGPVERAASKPGAVPEAVPLPPGPEGGDPGVNPRPGSGG